MPRSQDTLEAEGRKLVLSSLITGRNRLENEAAAALAKGACLRKP